MKVESIREHLQCTHTNFKLETLNTEWQKEEVNTQNDLQKSVILFLMMVL